MAVLDTGCDKNQEDLNSKVVSEVNFNDNSNLHDIHEHGTPITGIAIRSSNNGIVLPSWHKKSTIE